MTRLGIIAGEGSLPIEIYKTDKSAFVVGIDEHCNPQWAADYEVISFAKIGSIIKALKKAKVSKVVLAGSVKRSSLKKLKLDSKGLLLMSKVVAAGGGDDSSMRVIIDFLTDNGFEVLGTEDIIGNQTVPIGALGKIKPSTTSSKDIKRGIELLAVQSVCDVGQAVAVQENIILAVEAIEGTDEMIKRAGELKLNAEKPTLIKMIKSKQTRTVDMPTMGVETIKNLANSEFAGIAISASGIIIIDKEKVIDKADKLGLFIVAV